jgi:hypothetical protein
MRHYRGCRSLVSERGRRLGFRVSPQFEGVADTRPGRAIAKGSPNLRLWSLPKTEPEKRLQGETINPEAVPPVPPQDHTIIPDSQATLSRARPVSLLPVPLGSYIEREITLFTP